MAKLELFVSADCPTCASAQQVAAEVAATFPTLSFVVTDIDDSDTAVPDNVFAVPTLCLNGRIVSLGTPRWALLCHAIQQVLQQERGSPLQAD